MTQNSKIRWGLAATLLLASLAVNVWLMQTQTKTAYVEVGRIFGEFNGTQEMEAVFTKTKTQRKALLDSLSISIKYLQTQFGEQKSQAVLAKLQEKEQSYIQLSNEFSAEAQQQDQQYTEQIWTQINQYLLEFGEEKGYDYIYGASGNGSLMFGKEKNNITDEVIQFINAKYEGI
ncbi:MAG: OmpH family outer membrane protein [Bacteroidota bacterium]